MTASSQNSIQEFHQPGACVVVGIIRSVNGPAESALKPSCAGKNHQVFHYK